MTDDELYERFVADTGESDEATARDYIAQAREAVLNRRYPYATDAERAAAAVPERYRQVQERLAVALWARRGAEGETAHSENGVSRTYGDERELLSSVLPYVGFGGVS